MKTFGLNFAKFRHSAKRHCSIFEIYSFHVILSGNLFVIRVKSMAYFDIDIYPLKTTHFYFGFGCF